MYGPPSPGSPIYQAARTARGLWVVLQDLPGAEPFVDVLDRETRHFLFHRIERVWPEQHFVCFNQVPDMP